MLFCLISIRRNQDFALKINILMQKSNLSSILHTLSNLDIPSLTYLRQVKFDAADAISLICSLRPYAKDVVDFLSKYFSFYSTTSIEVFKEECTNWLYFLFFPGHRGGENSM